MPLARMKSSSRNSAAQAGLSRRGLFGSSAKPGQRGPVTGVETGGQRRVQRLPTGQARAGESTQRLEHAAVSLRREQHPVGALDDAGQRRGVPPEPLRQRLDLAEDPDGGGAPDQLPEAWARGGHHDGLDDGPRRLWRCSLGQGGGDRGRRSRRHGQAQACRTGRRLSCWVPWFRSVAPLAGLRGFHRVLQVDYHDCHLRDRHL